MSYTRPESDAVEFSWVGASAYTRPDHDAVEFSWEPPANIPTNLRTSAVTATTARLEWDAPT